jgi:malonyl-CoA O-methyltransferase
MSESRPSDGPEGVREAYRAWSRRYEVETAVSLLDRHAVEGLAIPLAGRSLLDAGCGVGRRLAAAHGARRAVGVDLVPEMLAAGRARWPDLRVAAADLRALPLRDAAFDLVWCRLVVGHLPAIERAYAELGRVARPGADVVVTDFHQEAVRAGHKRTFRDQDGLVHEVEHHVHDAEAQAHAARAAGLELLERQDVRVGPPVRDFYASHDRLDLYEQQIGLSLVLLLRFRKG